MICSEGTVTVALPELLTADELAARIHRSRRWIYRQADEREMPAIRVGRAMYFDAAAVAAWIDKQRIGTEATSNS
jgi:excisionase family DNA binding protein